MTSSGASEHKANRRGCVVLFALGSLILILLIAVSLGWLGQIDRAKISGIPAPADNQS
jgi:hypothetical protein